MGIFEKLFGKSISNYELIEKYNVSPKSKIISCHHTEIHKVTSEILKGVSPSMLSLSVEFILFSILEDGILFIGGDFSNPKFVERMFWKDTTDFGFKLEVKNLLFKKKKITISFLIKGKKHRLIFHTSKKNTDDLMSHDTLSFLQKNIS